MHFSYIVFVFFFFCTVSFSQESQFTVKVESPSPGGAALHIGEDQDTSPSKLSKEELIQSMDRVDREIAKVEQQIFKLKKKQVCSPVAPVVSQRAWHMPVNEFYFILEATHSFLPRDKTSNCEIRLS